MPRPRALVIDDERYVRELVCEVLCWIGCDVDAADNGIQGLALFERGGYDVVLTDASMPGMTGFEVADEVRRTAPHVGVILMTGSANGDAWDSSAGWLLLSKPFGLDQLKTLVAEALQATQALRS